MREGERLTDHATHGESHPVRALDAQPIEEGGDVAGELAQRVGARRHGTRAMAAHIDAHHAEMLLQRRRDAVPHGAVAADRMHEHDCLAAPFLGVREVDRRHFFLFFLPAASVAMTSRACLNAVFAAGIPQ